MRFPYVVIITGGVHTVLDVYCTALHVRFLPSMLLHGSIFFAEENVFSWMETGHLIVGRNWLRGCGSTGAMKGMEEGDGKEDWDWGCGLVDVDAVWVMTMTDGFFLLSWW